MRQYTTPTLNITLKHPDGTIASDIEFDYLIFSLRSACYSIDRRVETSDVIDGMFSVTFTQEETSKMKVGDNVDMEINFISGDTRFATNIKNTRLDKNLLQEII